MLLLVRAGHGRVELLRVVFVVFVVVAAAVAFRVAAVRGATAGALPRPPLVLLLLHERIGVAALDGAAVLEEAQARVLHLAVQRRLHVLQRAHHVRRRVPRQRHDVDHAAGVGDDVPLARRLERLRKLVALRVVHLPDVDVHRVLVDAHDAHVAHRRVDQRVLLGERALLQRVRQRARVRQRLDVVDDEVAAAHEVHRRARLEMRAAHVAEERDVPVALPPRRVDAARVRDVLDAVDQQVAVRVAPAQRPELDAREVQVHEPDLALRVLAVDDAAHVEHLGALVDLRPEPVLQLLLRVAQRLALLEAVQVRQHAHDAREAVRVQHVEELEGLHLEAEGRVDEQQHEVCDLGQVAHGVQVLPRALVQRHAAVLPRDHRDRPRDAVQVVRRVVLDERPDQRALAHARRPHHDHDERRRLLVGAVHLRHHLLLVRPVEVALQVSLGPPHVGHPEGPGVVALLRRAGLQRMLLLLLDLRPGLGLAVGAVRRHLSGLHGRSQPPAAVFGFRAAAAGAA